jgi:hypothetical protein
MKNLNEIMNDFHVELSKDWEKRDVSFEINCELMDNLDNLEETLKKINYLCSQQKTDDRCQTAIL